MSKVWCDFEQNQTKAVKVIEQKPISQSMYYQSQYKDLIVRITKWHNSGNTDPSAHIFLPKLHCLMVKVWCKFEQNWTKAIKVIDTLNVDGITDMLKTVYPTKTTFCRESISKFLKQFYIHVFTEITQSRRHFRNVQPCVS